MSILTTECVGGMEIHIQIEGIYGEHCMSESRFRSRTSAFAKEAWPFGWRYEWSIESFHIPACSESDDVIKKDHRVTVDYISAAVWLSHGTVHAIIVATLKFLKVCTQWVTTVWYQYKRPIVFPCICNCCSVTTVSTAFCQQLSPMMKVGATILSRNRNGKVCNGSAHIALQEKRSRACTLVLARQGFISSLIARFRSSLISWCVELEAIFSGILNINKAQKANQIETSW